MIISILAAAVLGVAAVAGETAREAKTRDMIAAAPHAADGALRHVSRRGA